MARNGVIENLYSVLWGAGFIGMSGFFIGAWQLRGPGFNLILQIFLVSLAMCFLAFLLLFARNHMRRTKRKKVVG